MSAPNPPRGDGWRRDWPMLAGLAVSASLVFASTVVGAPSDEEPASRPAAKTAATAGDAATAPTAEAPAAETAAATPEEAAKPAKKAKKAKTKAAAATAAGAVDDTPAAATPAPKKVTPKPTATKPNTPMILNVKGLSGVGRQNGMELTFGATSHSPAMGSLWTITVAGTKSGAPVTGTVRVDAVHKGEVVGKIHRGKFSGGKYRHSIRWPKEAVGQPLVVKTTIEAAGTTQTFLFAVRVGAAG